MKESIENEIQLRMAELGYEHNHILSLHIAEDNSLVTCQCNDGYKIQFQITDIKEFEYTNQFGKLKQDCYFTILEPIYS